MSLVPEFVAHTPRGAYRGLNPTTKAVLAGAEAFIAFGVRGWSGGLIVLAITLACAAYARIARRLIPPLLATIPLLASILIVNTLFFPNAHDVIVRIGPFEPTWTGLQAATQAAVRVIGFACSVLLFGLTTSADDLTADLERRGIGRRATFVVNAAIRTVPRMLARAGEITEAQRARGLDTQGGIRRRIQGLIPLAGPLVIGALTDVEEQTMALEARAFTAPGRRTVLRNYPDGPPQRLLRWGLTAGTAIVLVLSITGHLAFLP